MTRAPFDVTSFRSLPAIRTTDRAIAATVFAALAIRAEHGTQAATTWLMSDSRSIGGGWNEIALSAFGALAVGGREVCKNGN